MTTFQYTSIRHKLKSRATHLLQTSCYSRLAIALTHECPGVDDPEQNVVRDYRDYQLLAQQQNDDDWQQQMMRYEEAEKIIYHFIIYLLLINMYKKTN